MFSTTIWLLLSGPAALFAAGLAPTFEADHSPAIKIMAAKIAAAASVTLALLTAIGVILHGPMTTPLLGFQGVGVGLYLDTLAAMMLCLVSFIGLIVVVYSDHYMTGDPRHGHFIRWLCLTLASVLLVILSGNLFLFAVAWIMTSVGLNRLLVFYPDRPAAILAARKKFIASRLGDVCLLSAMVLLHRTFGTLDYRALFAAAQGLTAASAPVAVHVAAVLLVLTAMLKSAQLPLHGWLIEVMETPTTVSALLHAGIINAGGFLILRFSHIISVSTPALWTLSVIGGLTALFGSIVMLPQTSVKVALAYSTIAQMGFMMLECGLGAFSAALVHLLAHSLYKAHAFLSSGSVIDLARASWTPNPSGQPHPARMAISIVVVLSVTAAMAPWFGASVSRKPGVFTLGAVVLLGLIHLISNGIDERPNAYVLARTAGLAAAVAATYFTLQFLMEILLEGSLPPTQALRGPFDLVLVVAVIASFSLVTFFQSFVARSAKQAKWQALYVHVSNGLYLNTLANRWLVRFWPIGRSGSIAREMR